MVLGAMRGDRPRPDSGHCAVLLPHPLSPLARKATVVGSLTTAGRVTPRLRQGPSFPTDPLAGPGQVSPSLEAQVPAPSRRPGRTEDSGAGLCPGHGAGGTLEVTWSNLPARGCPPCVIPSHGGSSPLTGRLCPVPEQAPRATRLLPAALPCALLHSAPALRHVTSLPQGHVRPFNPSSAGKRPEWGAARFKGRAHAHTGPHTRAHRAACRLLAALRSLVRDGSAKATAHGRAAARTLRLSEAPLSRSPTPSWTALQVTMATALGAPWLSGTLPARMEAECGWDHVSRVHCAERPVGHTCTASSWDTPRAPHRPLRQTPKHRRTETTIPAHGQVLWDAAASTLPAHVHGAGGHGGHGKPAQGRSGSSLTCRRRSCRRRPPCSAGRASCCGPHACLHGEEKHCSATSRAPDMGTTPGGPGLACV